MERTLTEYPINNLLREPTEAWSAITYLSLALLAYSQIYVSCNFYISYDCYSKGHYLINP